jgi:protein-L-isoaspartate(D-aspartate) O-methyltransferase
VISLELVPELAWDARRRLERLGYDNAEVRLADGSLGLPEEAPFDAIVVTAGAQALPPDYLSQLKEGGRLVIPLGSHRHHQNLCRFTRTGGRVDLDDLGPFAFVPLTGRHGWKEPDRDGSEPR